MATYIELRFHAVGELAHRAAVDDIKRVSGVELLLDHTRELGWFERQRLLGDEWDCRIVVGVYDNAELREVARDEDSVSDPYRMLEFDGPVKQVPAKLAELIDALAAKYALVDHGWLRFETRIYEAALLEQLEADLTELAGTAVACRFARTGGVLRGRLTGYIPIIRKAHQALLRSGLIDVERVLVGYQ